MIYNKSDVAYYQATSKENPDLIKSGWATTEEIFKISKTYSVVIFPLFFRQDYKGEISYHQTLAEVLVSRIYGIYIPVGINLIGCGINVPQLKKVGNHYFIGNDSEFDVWQPRNQTYFVTGDGFLDFDVWRPKKYQTKLDYRKDGDEPYFLVEVSFVRNNNGILEYSDYYKIDYVRAIDSNTAIYYCSIHQKNEPFLMRAKKVRFYSVTSYSMDGKTELGNFFTYKTAFDFVKKLPASAETIVISVGGKDIF